MQHGHEDGTGELAHPSGLPGAPVDHAEDDGSGVRTGAAKGSGSTHHPI
jgi:hypothetical protein